MELLLIEFVESYGLNLFLIALSGILILGVLKYFRVFNKIQKEKRKYIYAGVSATLSIIATILYLAVVNDITFATIIVLAPATYALNQAAYAFYETTGLRTALKMLGDFMLNLIAKSRIETKQSKLLQGELETRN